MSLLSLLKFRRAYREKLYREKPSQKQLLIEELKLIGAALVFIAVLFGIGFYFVTK
jgi:hypothetical protein